MTTTNPLLIGLSGLLASQRGIATTGHNIANTNTDGFSRQRVEFGTRPPLFLGNGFAGTGVESGDIRRIIDRFAIAELRNANSAFNQVDNFLTKASRLDNLLGNTNSGLSTVLQQFFSSSQGVTTQADSIPGRQVMLSQSNTLTQRFGNLYSQIAKEREALNAELTDTATVVTSLSASIAQLNGRIQDLSGNGTSELPNDLLDERDQLLKQLSEQVGIQVVQQDGQQLNVYITNGQPLVVGRASNTLSTKTSVTDPNTIDFILTSGTASVNLGQTLSGGKIGGASGYLRNVLEPALNRLGLVAVGLAGKFNAQHQLGMDLNNNLGGLYFTDINDPTLVSTRAVGSTANTGNAAFAISIPDTAGNGIDRLTASDYRLVFDGANYQLTRLSDNTVTTLPGTFPGTPADIDGFRITLTAGAMNAGDSFRIQPTKDFASRIQVLLTDAKTIAASSPIRTLVPLTNTGSAEVRDVRVTSTVAATTDFNVARNGLDRNLSIRFVAPAAAATIGYEIYDPTAPLVVLATGTFNRNQDNAVLSGAVPAMNVGYDIVIAGSPNVGDVIDFSYNSGGVGDNRNMIALGALQTTAFLDGNNATLNEAYGTLVSAVGARTAEADINQKASETLLRQAENRRESVAGVNLDEEAANLIKFQQAYAASAQVINVANQIFDTLISSVR